MTVPTSTEVITPILTPELHDLFDHIVKTVSRWNRAFGLGSAYNADMRLAIEGEEVLELARAGTTTDMADAIGDVLWTHAGSVIDFEIEGGVLDYLGAVTTGLEDVSIDDNSGTGCDVCALTIMGMISRGLIYGALADKQPNYLTPATETMAGAAIYMLVKFSETFDTSTLRRIFGEVSRTNFAKLWTEAELADLPTDWTVAQATRVKYVVKNKHGKIMKPASWAAPDFSFAVCQNATA